MLHAERRDKKSLRRKALNLKPAPTRATTALRTRRPRNAPKWPDRVNPPETISRLTGRMGEGKKIMDGSHHTGFVEASTAFAAFEPVAIPILATGSRFRVRSLRLDPGQTTSLQSHLHRSGHWVVVEGTAEITVGIRARLVGEGEAVHIPLGQPHRLENPGRLPVTLIAVETGCYLGEDDVVRHD